MNVMISREDQQKIRMRARKDVPACMLCNARKTVADGEQNMKLTARNVTPFRLYFHGEIARSGRQIYFSMRNPF